MNINGDEEYIVCEYCDSKIKLDLPHEEKHNEDAVKLRQIEVEREFKLKAIEKEEQEAAKKNKVKKITIITWLGVSAILLLISVIKMNLSDSDGLGGFFIYENAHVALDQVEYQKRYDGLTARFDAAKARYESLDETIRSKQSRRATIEDFLATLKDANLVDTFDTALWCGLVDFVTVHSKDDVRFTFKNGQEIKA